MFLRTPSRVRQMLAPLRTVQIMGLPVVLIVYSVGRGLICGGKAGHLQPRENNVFGESLELEEAKFTGSRREDCCGNNSGTNMVKGRLLQRLGRLWAAENRRA